ncbi:MAG: hypothetical protein HPY50_11870 [Firmicutes bacterium]|nr:hypothetical protein [Bacillota bacterium]
MKSGAMLIELTGKESQMLHEILENYLKKLQVELSGTDSADYREYLREKEAFIKDMLSRLPAFGRVT